MLGLVAGRGGAAREGMGPGVAQRADANPIRDRAAMGLASLAGATPSIHFAAIRRDEHVPVVYAYSSSITLAFPRRWHRGMRG